MEVYVGGWAEFDMKDTYKLLDELSILSRETNGASFVISHNKETGQWKITFTNVMLARKALQFVDDFDEAIENAIKWIKDNRKSVEVPIEKYTLFS